MTSMKKVGLVILGVLALIEVARECGVVDVGWFNSEQRSIRGVAWGPLLDFRDVESVEVVNKAGQSRTYHVSRGKRQLRLKVKDAYTDIAWERWAPLYKTGKSIERLYLSIESRTETDPVGAYTPWGDVVSVEYNITLTVRGIQSARGYRNMVEDAALAFTDSDFAFLSKPSAP
jgi:hypothetical protein